MKKLILLFVFIPFLSNAQLLAGKNKIKVNLSSLAFNNYHATYERSLTKRLSISLSYRYMSKQHIPLEDAVKNYVDDPNLDLGTFMMGNNAITPELRLYTGKGKGFYVAFYGRMANFDFTVPLKYQSTITGTTSTANFDGIIKSTSGGIMFGIQHNIAKALVLDFWILGAHYGSSSGKLVANNFSPALSNQQERDALKKSINDFDASPFKIKGDVAADGKSAYIESDGPWAGVRGLGLSLGIKF